MTQCDNYLENEKVCKKQEMVHHSPAINSTVALFPECFFPQPFCTKWVFKNLLKFKKSTELLHTTEISPTLKAKSFSDPGLEMERFTYAPSEAKVHGFKPHSCHFWYEWPWARYSEPQDQNQAYSFWNLLSAFSSFEKPTHFLFKCFQTLS